MHPVLAAPYSRRIPNRELFNLHKERRLYRVSRVVSKGATTRKNYTSGGHLEAQITRAKRPRTTIYHQTARRGVPHTVSLHYIFVSFWSCRAFASSQPFLYTTVPSRQDVLLPAKLNFLNGCRTAYIIPAHVKYMKFRNIFFNKNKINLLHTNKRLSSNSAYN
jgi:hypothetical protein